MPSGTKQMFKKGKDHLGCLSLGVESRNRLSCFVYESPQEHGENYEFSITVLRKPVMLNPAARTI